VVVPFNAQRIRLFAKAKGRLAKNNRGDAHTIAQATARVLHGCWHSSAVISTRWSST